MGPEVNAARHGWDKTLVELEVGGTRSGWS